MQALRAYNAGKEIARTDPSGVPNTYALNSMAIKGGSDYIFTIAGSLGDPYGSYRGHPGIRWGLGRHILLIDYPWASMLAFSLHTTAYCSTTRQ